MSLRLVGGFSSRVSLGLLEPLGGVYWSPIELVVGGSPEVGREKFSRWMERRRCRRKSVKLGEPEKLGKFSEQKSVKLGNRICQVREVL